ncbi:MAG: DUF6785 family protein [Armatimonadota bacterium]
MAEEAQAARPGVSLRSVLIGSVLIFLNCYWIIEVEGIWHWAHPTAISLMWNVVFSLLILLIINAGLRRASPHIALTQGEFVTIYVMMAIASALAGHDSLQLGIPGLTFGWWFATPANNWEGLFWKYLPKWLTVSDFDIIEGFHDGHTTFYTRERIVAFLGPIAWWCAFILALGLVLVCICVLVRKQWTEHEKLGYPIVQIPLAMTEGGGTGAIWRNRLMWAGLILAAAFDLWNGLSVFYPAIPMIKVRHDAQEHWIRTQSWGLPWSAMGNIWMPFYPFIIALGFLLPLDLSFSIWFFFVFRKLQQVAARAYPIAHLPLLPYLNEQSTGAWMALFGYGIYMGRRYFKDLVTRAIHGRLDTDATGELMSHRVAFLGMMIGGAFIVVFCLKMGMTIPFIIPFFAFYFMLSTAVTRMRAELGPPAHEMAGGMNSGQVICTWVGTRAVGPANLVAVPLFYWFTGRGYRTHPMPHQLEAFKMAEVAGMDPKRLGWAMALAFLLGGFASYWWACHFSYQFGDNGMTMHNWGQWNQLASRLGNPQPPNYPGMGFMGVGVLMAVFMMVMRARYTWWPFHPAGYALGMLFGVDYFWSCLLISWLLKLAILRWGGYKPYARVLPFMTGIVLGEYCVGAFWSALSVILKTRTYDFCPG